MKATAPSAQRQPRHRRALNALRCSLKLRLMMVFVLLALGVAFAFIGGAQKAFSVGWRDAARPLLMDYVDRLAADIAPAGSAPSTVRAQAITQRLPITIDITGPLVNWRSHPQQPRMDWKRHGPPGAKGRDPEDWGDDKDWQQLLQRTTADGHRLDFGLNEAAFERRPRLFGFTLTVLLLLTLLAFLYLRRLLRPLDDIRQGALRFGAGEFGQPIPVRHPNGPDELGELAATINTMGHDIHQMLEAQRALLLAISHELRSPLTRARLNTELLPDTADVTPQRDALLRDLAEMAQLISDLLESERLAGRHQTLHREPTDVAVLAREVIDELATTQSAAGHIHLHSAQHLPTLSLDRIRIRLLLRNLLDNALRHSAGAPMPPELHIRRVGEAGQGIEIEVRDHGPGVPEDQLPHLAQAFFRPDTARTRNAGGVGLGLYLCRLVAQAHGGIFAVRNARPGLAVTVTLPGV
ncbi:MULTISPECIES: HAMP domain-containing sensor histidine kinase [Comamonadaceae]|uniref:HAMP domain-containing sensor histidine kinase n=1 Tax=Comamonadaceae TaxID=80864 RepID=UPI00272F5AE5|nr:MULTISPECIES: HAMP domain-containing sensor histidine kinase [Comamonadaceae]MDP2016824.1 HAMP domain-containing sensor histidine kinase [Hydrogenophaga sp.]MDP3190082.1 HAMP domain-containing sensor histidine kinase [Rhodoferax sp.]